MSSEIFRQRLSFNAYSMFSECPHEALKKFCSRSIGQDIFSESYSFEYVDFFNDQINILF